MGLAETVSRGRQTVSNSAGQVTSVKVARSRSVQPEDNLGYGRLLLCYMKRPRLRAVMAAGGHGCGSCERSGLLFFYNIIHDNFVPFTLYSVELYGFSLSVQAELPCFAESDPAVDHLRLRLLSSRRSQLNGRIRAVAGQIRAVPILSRNSTVHRERANRAVEKQGKQHCGLGRLNFYAGICTQVVRNRTDCRTESCSGTATGGCRYQL